MAYVVYKLLLANFIKEGHWSSYITGLEPCKTSLKMNELQLFHFYSCSEYTCRNGKPSPCAVTIQVYLISEEWSSIKKIYKKATNKLIVCYNKQWSPSYVQEKRLYFTEFVTQHPEKLQNILLLHSHATKL